MEGLHRDPLTIIFKHCNVRGRVALASTCRRMRTLFHKSPLIEDWANLSRYQRLLKAIEYNEQDFLNWQDSHFRVDMTNVYYHCAKYNCFDWFLYHHTLSSTCTTLPALGFYCALYKRVNVVKYLLERYQTPQHALRLRIIAGASATRDSAWLEQAVVMCDAGCPLPIVAIYDNIEIGLMRIDGPRSILYRGALIGKNRVSKGVSVPWGNAEDVTDAVNANRFEQLRWRLFNYERDFFVLLERYLKKPNHEFIQGPARLQHYITMAMRDCSVRFFATHCTPERRCLVEAYNTGNLAVVKYIASQLGLKIGLGVWKDLLIQDILPQHKNVRLRQFVEAKIVEKEAFNQEKRATRKKKRRRK